jgi:hypothetical protein
MTAAVELASAERYDVRTVIGGGVKLGLVTIGGVVVFALLSRSMTGAGEVVMQSLVILAGGIAFAYLPAVWVRPRTVDGIAWAAMVGLLGALVFTLIDTAALRPLHLYRWTWDAIGGGSGFWYIPVWWMGSAFLAWLGAWVVALSARGGREPNPLVVGALTAGVGIVLFAASVGTRLLPFHAAIAALAFGVGLILHVPLAAITHRR